MSERAAPHYCPYCGDEDLRPEPDSHRAWNCRACARTFELAFLGIRLHTETYTSGRGGGVEPTQSTGVEQ
jgi:ribosomal protein L37AE/L43A